MLLPMLNILYFYISATTVSAVPSMVVFCGSLISCFLDMLLRYVLNDF